MKEILLFIGVILLFYLNEKFGILSYSNIKNIIKNFLLILPFISLYFGKDTISKFMHNKFNNNYNNNRSVSQTTKKIVASNQQWKCNICRNLLNYTYEIDHIIPLYKGGTNNPNNLQALCRNCHGEKTVMDKFI